MIWSHHPRGGGRTRTALESESLHDFPAAHRLTGRTNRTTDNSRLRLYYEINNSSSASQLLWKVTGTPKNRGRTDKRVLALTTEGRRRGEEAGTSPSTLVGDRANKRENSPRKLLLDAARRRTPPPTAPSGEFIKRP